MSLEERRLYKARKLGLGLGLVKGLAVTLKHLFKHNTVIQYPEEKQDLGPRTRGVIALKEENCTVCMLCARECPDWCIYIDSHKETLPPKREGGRPRKRNVLDRFAIDYALCMYCGICVEVCPYDALFWSREFEYAEYDIRELTHEKERLSDWMSTVLPPPPLDEGAEQPGRPAPLVAANGGPAAIAAETPAAPAAIAPAAAPEAPAAKPAAGATTPASAPTMAPEGAGEVDQDRLPPPPSPTTEAAAPAPAPAPEAEAPAPEAAAAPATETPAPAPTEPEASALTPEDKAAYTEQPGPNVEVPHEEPHPISLQPTEDAEVVYRSVLEEQKAKGSSPQVAEARARVARAKAERGIQRGPTPLSVDKPVPSAPTKGHSETEPSGAPEAEAPQPDPGPVAPTPTEPEVAPTTEASSDGSSETPDQVYERVLAEQKAKGSSDAVATGRAKAARVKAERAQGKS
jgi:formate hydrogenlyase subunit 6/NADH:ubiquinone oxidoreductase subunit I